MKPCLVVSEEMGSQGDLVALETSQLTGRRLILRDGIRKLARARGLPGEEWRWLEQGWSRLFAPLDGQPNDSLRILQPALLDGCADRRGALFFGRGIGQLLQGHVPLFRVHVVASFDARVERIMRDVNIMRSRAEERVHRSDAENAWFYRHFFGLDCNAPGLYDLIIDTATHTVAEAALRIIHGVSAFQGKRPRGACGGQDSRFPPPSDR